MIKRTSDIINYQFEKYENKTDKIYFVPLSSDGESELIRTNTIQGFDIDLKNNTLKKSIDLTDFILTKTGDHLNDLTNLLKAISKLSPAMLKAVFLYEDYYNKFNDAIKQFKTIVTDNNLDLLGIETENPFLSDKIKYFINNVNILPSAFNRSEDLITLSNYIRGIRETKLIFIDYYENSKIKKLPDRYVEGENSVLYFEYNRLNYIKMFFDKLSDNAYTALKYTKFFT